MNELTDLEICKPIAEIENVEFRVQNGKVLPEDPAQVITSKLTDVYNPLTDDALCFRLMVKYKIWRWSNPAKGKFNVCIKNFAGWISAETLNKAICLAIIESKKSK